MEYVVSILLFGGLIYGLYRLNERNGQVERAIDVLETIVDNFYAVVFRAIFTVALFAWLPTVLAVPIFAFAVALPILLNMEILGPDTFLIAEAIVMLFTFIGYVNILGFGMAILVIIVIIVLQHWRLIVGNL